MTKITVKVTDDKGRPIPFISVTVGPKNAPTAVDGVASIDLPKQGTFRLAVRSQLHAPYNDTIKVPPLHHEVKLSGAIY